MSIVSNRVRFPKLAGTRPRTLIGAPLLPPSASTGREIRLIEEDEGGWSAIDEELNVASQGETREEVLANLDEAVELTKEAREADSDAPEPDAPWFEG
jgi:predicted RNase H-like HicB family nuclease